MISLDLYYALLVLQVRMISLGWPNFIAKKKITITFDSARWPRVCGEILFFVFTKVPGNKIYNGFARATVLSRYHETMIFFVSVPLQIEEFAKVRTISKADIMSKTETIFRKQFPVTILTDCRLCFLTKSKTSVPAGLTPFFLYTEFTLISSQSTRAPNQNHTAPKQCWLLNSHLYCLHQNIAHGFRVTLCKRWQTLPLIWPLNCAMGHCAGALTLGKQTMNWNHVWQKTCSFLHWLIAGWHQASGALVKVGASEARNGHDSPGFVPFPRGGGSGMF